MFILQVCDFRDDGDGHYRLHEPSRYLARLLGVVVVDCHPLHRALPALVREADVLVLPFLHNWDLFPLIEDRRGDGKATVFEANDYFYDVQTWSPIAAQWQDRAIQEEYRHYMAAADAVQTSTEELARRWRPMSRRVAVFANHLVEVQPLAPPPVRPLTVGWGGSPGHFADWFHIAPALEGWLAAHPDVHLSVMTNEFARPFLSLPPERYRFTPFGSLANYLQFLNGLDIGLAPLLPTEYNRCRSDVKFLEYAAAGVAGIYSDLEPYRTVVDGETGLLFRSAPEMLGQLDRLVTDAALRDRIRRQAHAHVAQHRRLAEHIGERLEYYRGLLPAGPRSGKPSAEAVAEAVRDGNYYQLRPGEPERTLMAVQGPPKRESAETLGRLVEQHSGYIAALQQLGLLLNNLGDCRAALNALGRALALNPRSAFTLAEIGRAHFRLGDLAAARRNLESALAVNPLFHPGWQYLLRLLAHQHAGDGPTWAQRAEETFPHDYPLALIAARLYSGGGALAVLRRLLETHARTLTPAERPAAVAAFSQAFFELVGPNIAHPEAIELLGLACSHFSESTRLADLHARALHRAGRRDEALAEFARALTLKRAAATYHAEYPKDDGSLHYWQFAETIRSCVGAD